MPRYANMQERIQANTVMEWNQTLQSYCWIWIGARNSRGYGKMSIRIKRGPRKGKVKSCLAHRESYKAFKAKKRLTEKSVVRHRCDIQLCCAPDHLLHGEQVDNVADCVKRGRHVCGYNVWQQRKREEVL